MMITASSVSSMESLRKAGIGLCRSACAASVRYSLVDVIFRLLPVENAWPPVLSAGANDWDMKTNGTRSRGELQPALKNVELERLPKSQTCGSGLSCKS